MGGASPGNGATRPPAACRASLYQEGHVASAGWRRWLLIPQQGLRSTLKWCDIRGVAGRPGGAEEAEGPRPCCPSPPPPWISRELGTGGGGRRGHRQRRGEGPRVRQRSRRFEPGGPRPCQATASPSGARPPGLSCVRLRTRTVAFLPRAPDVWLHGGL